MYFWTSQENLYSYFMTSHCMLVVPTRNLPGIYLVIKPTKLPAFERLEALNNWKL